MSEIEMNIYIHIEAKNASNKLLHYFSIYKNDNLDKARSYAIEHFSNEIIPTGTALASCSISENSINAALLGGSSLNFHQIINDLSNLQPKYLYIEILLDGSAIKKYGSIDGCAKNYKSVLKEMSKHDVNIGMQLAVPQVKDKLVKQYLKMGANPNLRIDGRPSVFYFTDYHRWGVVKEFLMAGTDPDSIETVSGNLIDAGDPLLCGIIRNQINPNDRKDLIKLIIDKGANVNCTTENFKLSPLHLAIQEGHHLVVKLLLENGADKHIISSDNLTPLETAKKYRDIYADRNEDYYKDKERVNNIDKAIKYLDRSNNN